MILHMAWGRSSTPMEMCTKALSLRRRPMGRVFSKDRMEMFTMESGKGTSLTDKEQSAGMTVLVTKGSS